MHRPKMSPKGLRRGAAELLVRPIPIGPNQTEFSHGVSHRVPYDSSWVYHLISLPEDPPLRGLYKEEESPHSTHHQHVELVLHCKGEVLPRLVLKVGGG